MFFFSSRRRHTRLTCDWSSDVCSSDLKDCNSQNTGCRWYSAFYNTVDSAWTHTSSEKILKVCDSSNPNCVAVLNGCEVDGSGLTVPQWQQTAALANKGIIMSEPCETESGCVFDDNDACAILSGGVTCAIDQCLSANNIISALNPGFELMSTADWDAKFWSEDYQSDSNRQFRSSTDKKTGNYSLESLSFGNSNPLTTTLPIAAATGSVSANRDYQLSFYARGSISQGSISVKVYSGDLELGGYTIGSYYSPGANWQKYSVSFRTQDLADGDKLDIKVITDALTTGSMFFDDFELKEISTSCLSTSVYLTLGSQDEADYDIYFDRDAEACSSSAVGCSQFIRTKAGLGSNLIHNPSFEDGADEAAEGWVFAKYESVQYESADGQAKRTSASGAAHSGTYAAELLRDNNYRIWTYEKPIFDLSAGDIYILSGWIKTLSVPAHRDIIIDLYFFDPNQEKGQLISEAVLPDDSTTGVWHRLEKKFTAERDYTGVRVRLLDKLSGNSVYFDDVKLEKVAEETASASSYTPYNPSQRSDVQLAYVKKAPAYYNCYLTNDGNWPKNLEELQEVIAGRDTACANYSSVCISSEMNCELYTPANGDPAVPGTITSADVCPSECAGYQVYQREPTNFTSAKYEQFINKSPIKTCSVAAVGCDEFTNLDEVERGGEGLEYYTQLRVCQKPDAYNDDQATYYTWEGNDTTGYQLKVFELKKSTRSNAPCTNLSYDNGGGNFCSDPTAGDDDNDDLQNYDDPDQNSGACLSSDLNTNPDCRELYDTNGNIYYRLLSRVIYVSDDCHPYRRTQTQSSSAEAASDCRNNQGYYNSFNECIYLAIPGQGSVCPASSKGCREYTGNRGDSFINIILSDFETGDNGWQGGTISAEATHPGGNSLTNELNDSKKLSRAVLVGQNKIYTVSFWAKGAQDFDLDSVRFSEAPAKDSFMTFLPEVVTTNDLKISITDQWQRYDLGPVFVTWSSAIGYFSQNLEINIPSGQVLYIDNILLKELPQSVFAIANSWFTPYACDNNFDTPNGSGGSLNPTRDNPGQMIGCQEYRDRSNQTWFLKSFENLCRADAVGCEELIDIHNSDC